MNRKISKILGVGLSLALLISLVIMAAPVTAGTLSWSAPTVLSTTDFGIAPADTELTDLVVAPNGTTIYAATGTGALYKSTDGGKKWTDLALTGGAVAHRLASPVDSTDGSVIAYVNQTAVTVSVSTNGGTTWSSLGTPAETGGTTASKIMAIDVSRDVSGVKNVIVGGINTAGGAGLWYFNLGATVTKWVDAASATSWTVTDLYATGGGAVHAVKASPNYPSDRTVIVITGPHADNATGTKVALQAASFNAKKWNDAVYGSGWNDGVSIETIDAGKIVTAASIALSSGYQAADTSTRLAYVGYATDDAVDIGGLFRFSDTTKKALKSAIGIQSVAYNSTTDKLVAGATASNQVYRSANPGVTDPTVSSGSTYRIPGGADSTNVVVAWAGTATVAAVTKGAESAFSTSADDGKTFNDISLIDNNSGTTPVALDVAVSADGSKVYRLTRDGDGLYLSLWGNTLTSGKILRVKSAAAHIVRVAPENADVVYVGEVGGTTIYYSTNAGASWTVRYSDSVIADMAVESASVVYVLTAGGSVSKTTDSGFIWGSAKATGLGSGATIVSLAKDNLIVGGTAGNIAYSTDANANWTKVTATISGGAGKVQVTADGLTTGKFIYAGTSNVTADDYIYRWKIDPATTSWSKLSATKLGAGYGVDGITLSDGALYAMTSDGVNSKMWRDLSPSTHTADSDTGWSSVALAGKAFNSTPRALVASKGAQWAINNTAKKLESFSDTVVKTAPTVKQPAADYTIPINAQTGIASDVVYSWTGISKVTEYQLQVAYDSAFTQLVIPASTIASTEDTVVVTIGPNAADGAGNKIQYQADTAYYWRVRAKTPVLSPWAAARKMTAASLVTFDIVSPLTGSTNVPVTPTLVWAEFKGALNYEVQIGEDPAFKILDISTNAFLPFYVVKADESLAYGTTYYWRVRGVTGAGTAKKAAPGGPWKASVFTTVPKPVEPTPPVVIQPTPPTKTEIVTVQVPATPIVVPQPIPSYLLWIIIGIGAILIIALIILIARTRRVA